MTPSIDAYRRVRRATLEMVAGLGEGDMTPQSAEFASPAKWHLAHTTWFFEQFVLQAHGRAYRPFDERYAYLFNSYYNAVGPRHQRPRRGLLTRPALAEVLAYRAHVDHAMENFLDGAVGSAAGDLIELGLNHEQQHQELILTDLLHLFGQNALRPAVRAVVPVAGAHPAGDPQGPGWIPFDGGLREIGHAGRGFAFDSEGPRHTVCLRPFRLAGRCVTNREWQAFIADGGYRKPSLWLSDGWDMVQSQGWDAPLYWEPADALDGAARMTLTLDGPALLDPDAPVAHVSYFEADAFANWAGRRLPTESEWEHAAGGLPVEGNFAESGAWRPRAARSLSGEGASSRTAPAQMFGDVWEWTSSPYVAYPGFRRAAGAVGEYNGKFMNGQYVLRGGSCVSPGGHLRATYRNFFQPGQRWQFSGLRLAEDA
jgi:ergothioneine biosynthesis protein EgtB